MRTMILSLLFVLFANCVRAQDASVLLGKWNVEYVDSEDKAIYEFKKEDNQIIGYCISYVDETGEEDSLMDKIITDITLNGNKGRAKYSGDYDGIKFKMKCKLKIIDANHVETEYSYLLYSGKEIWSRITKDI